MASWRYDHDNADRMEREEIEALKQALLVVAVFLVCLAGLAYGPEVFRAIGL